MNIIIISPGKSKNFIGEDIVIEYTSRLSHYTNIEWKYISSSDMKEEGEKIAKAIPDGSYVAVLDEKGKSFSSIEFSDFLNKRMNESVKSLVFIIGGAYGISSDIKEKANIIWSLSALVFPHELVRSILSEQLYRGFTILKGEKYHHE